jgi:hypothetical protein
MMAHYAILAGKLSWINDKTLDVMAKDPNTLMRYISDHSTAVTLNNRYDLIEPNDHHVSQRILTWPLAVVQLARELDLIGTRFVKYYMCNALYKTSIDILDAMLADRTVEFLHSLRTQPKGMIGCSILGALEHAIKRGNLEIVKHLLENYPDIVDPYIPSRLLSTVSKSDRGHSQVAMNYLRELIVEKQLPIHDLNKFILNLDIDFLQKVFKYLDLDEYSSNVTSVLTDLAKASRKNPKETMAMLELLNEYFDGILSHPNLVQNAGASNQLLLYLYDREPDVIIANRDLILKSAKKNGNKVMIQTVIDLLGPF